jgi:fructokinase
MNETDGADMRIGIDIGGTKIAAMILDGEGRERARFRREISRDYDGTVENISDTVSHLEEQAGRANRIGISMPGVVNRSGEPIMVANLPWLRDKPFRPDLERLFERPVHIGNDANCFALSEATDGSAAGAKLVFGVILGTGVGGAIVVNGQIVTGANAIAGEWGHNPLPWRTPEDGAETMCGCGQTGCIETWLNGAALSRDYQALSGSEAKAKDISRLAEENDASATQAISQYAERLARALASAINFFDPDIIVLGGGLSEISGLYDQVPELWGRHTSTKPAATRLVKAAHGPESGMRGAAWL